MGGELESYIKNNIESGYSSELVRYTQNMMGDSNNVIEMKDIPDEELLEELKYRKLGGLILIENIPTNINEFVGRVLSGKIKLSTTLELSKQHSNIMLSMHYINLIGSIPKSPMNLKDLSRITTATRILVTTMDSIILAATKKDKVKFSNYISQFIILRNLLVLQMLELLK